MDRVAPSQKSDLLPLEAESEALQLRVDFFRKLGYPSDEVRTALSKLGLNTDTNSVLAELLRSRNVAAPSAANGDSDDRSTGQKDPLLPPSWALGPCRATVPQADRKHPETDLRPVVIDGSNVAMSHGNKEVFSCRGIQLAVNYFLDRSHTNITVFVPSWRKEQPRPDTPLTDQHILMELEKQKIVVFTPSRRVGGKRVVCYDDRFIVKLAYESDGVIVSNDTYRDLQGERPEWKKCIEERLLMYSFVNDKFMPPDDPLGRHGPSLDNFLRTKPLHTEQKRQLCPYDKKCTYGIKCKFYHPERTSQSYLSLADELREKAQISTMKDDRKSKFSKRHLRPNPEPAHSAFSHNIEFDTAEKSYLHPGQVCENTMHGDERRNSPNLMTCSVTGDQCQKEWPPLLSVSNQYYASMSSEHLDSGLGSYESQYSIPHYLGITDRLRPQQQNALSGSRNPSVHLENSIPNQAGRCCSHAVPSALCGNSNLDYQPKSDTCPSHRLSLSTSHKHSLPSHLQYGGTVHHQREYWSDPFQGLPQARSSHHLSTSVQSSHQRNSCCCCHKDQQYYCWAPQHTPSTNFDPQRLEVRKKLQAIFNPRQVDTVMNMFPHLMDAEKLAVEIINLKSQRGVFS